MLKILRNYFAKRPNYFIFLRKVIELNFRKQKSLIGEVFGNQDEKKVLDIGCGTGEYSNSFKPENYTGIDISSEYISHAKKTKKGNFLVMDATNLSFPDNSFDVILIAAILHHLNDKDVNKVLRGAKRVLKKEGKILIMEDAKIKNLDNGIVRFIQKFDLGANIRTPDEYRDMFSSYFLKVKEWEFRNGGCTYYCSLMRK